MTELEKHIVNLLLDNDCVIVPGFGGFMAHRIPASYDKANGLFIPPSRTIGFNPLLTMNDSLLAQAYANTYDISYPEALRHIESDVDGLKRTIESEGVHNICGVGNIILMPNGSYDFQPNKDGFISPEYYGFDTFEMETLKADSPSLNIEESKDTHTQSATKVVSIFDNKDTNSIVDNQGSTAEQVSASTEQKEISLRIPLSIVKQIAAACIVAILFMSFPAKMGDSSRNNTSRGAIDTSLLYTIMPKEMTSGKPEKLNSTQSTTQTSTSEPQASEENTLTTNTCKPYYTIVMASRVTKKNAEQYVQKLHQSGFKEAQVHISNGCTKVIYKKFDNWQSAQKVLKALPQTDTFKDCWITTVK